MSKGILKNKSYEFIKGMVFFTFSLLAFHLSNAQQLQFLIEEALTNNPEVQSFELKYKVAKEKVNEMTTFPNTQIGVGYFVSEPETRTGAQQVKISAKQMLPFFGTITARENYINSLADAVYEDIAITKRKLTVTVSQSYYTLYTLEKKQSILDDNIKLLKTYEKLALTSVEVGNASAVDVLRLQMRQNELKQLKQVIEQDYLAELTAFNKLLNRNKETKVHLDNELNMSTENTLIKANDLSLHPELLKYDKLYHSIEQSELLNKKEGKPMLGFGLDYIAVSERPNMEFSDNGKDIIMPTVSFSVPLFSKKHSARSKQYEFQKEEMFQKREASQNNLENIMEEAINNRITARINYNTQQKNIAQAREAEKIMLSAYQTSQLDFEELLDIQQMLLDFENKKIEAVAMYFKQTAILNYLR